MNHRKFLYSVIVLLVGMGLMFSTVAQVNVSPASLTINVFTGEAGSDTLTITNNGLISIDWDVTETAAASLRLPDGQEIQVDVTNLQKETAREQYTRMATSTGDMALLESPVKYDPPVDAPGDVLYSAAFGGSSALGMTQTTAGDVYVADLYDGLTYVYDDALVSMGSISSATPGGAVVGGVAYDTVNNTLWWQDIFGNTLYEGDLSGTATGNTIALGGLGGSELLTGAEYDPVNDWFLAIDIVNDDIWAWDRTGTAVAGYPVPQTNYDTGAGLFGNGLDAHDGLLEVLVGTVSQVDMVVPTDMDGVNVGGIGSETPVGPTGDTFINDATRNRLDDTIMFLVGNATNTIYAVEAAEIALADPCPWLAASPTSGTVAASSSADVAVDVASAGLTPGSYDCDLTFDWGAGSQVVPVTMNVSDPTPADIAVTYSGFQPPGAPGPLFGDDTVFFYVNNISSIFNDDTASMSFTLRNLGDLDLYYEIIDVASTTLSLSLDDKEQAVQAQRSIVEEHPFVVRRMNQEMISIPTETAEVDLVIDDSSVESAIGVGGGQWLWMNQFRPTTYPFDMDSIAIAWDSTVAVGDLFDVYIYADTDGDDDFSNAVLMGSELNLPVVDISGFWSGYAITPITFTGPGDVLIAVVNRMAQPYGYPEFPALGDDDFYHDQSWVGIWYADPPDPPTFPADLSFGKIGDFGLPTNWLVRGHGTWTGGCDWLTDVTPSQGILEGGGQTTVTLTVDHIQAPGVYYCDLNILSNDDDTPVYTITLCLNVLDEWWAEFSTEVQSIPPGNPIAPLDSIRDLFTFINHTLLETRVSIETKWLRNTGQEQQQMNPRTPVLLPFEVNTNRNKKFEVPATMPLGTNHVISIVTTDDGVDTICTDTFAFDVVSAAAKAEMMGLASSTSGLPTTLDLHANYPNPFNPTTTIKYDLNEDLNVKINVYNVLGQHVKTLVDGFQKAGYRQIEWDGTNAAGATVASGIYIYRMETAGFTKSYKMLLTK